MQHTLFFSMFLLMLLLSRVKKTWINEVSLLYFMVVIFVFLSIRVGYGNDYYGYEHIFNAVKSGTGSHGQSDRLFFYLNYFSPSFRALIVIVSLFYVVVLYNVFKKWITPKYYYLACCFLILNPYLFFIHSSVIRQSIAMLFFLVALLFLERKKYIIYSLFILIASGFHFSALILFVVPFLVNSKRLSIKFISAVFVVLVFFAYFGVFEFLVNKIVRDFFPLFIVYLDNGIEPNLRTLVISLVFLILNIVSYYKCDDDKVFICKLGLLSCGVSILYFSFPIVSRFDIYFGFFSVFSIIHLFENTKIYTNRILLIFSVFILFLLRYISFFNTPLWDKFSIYNTIL